MDPLPACNRGGSCLIDDGAIEEVRQLQADLGVDRPYDPADRLFDPAQGGGAMLDLGVYVVSFAQYFLGTPDRIAVSGSLAPTGVDAEAGLLLGYDDGRVATLLISLKHHTPGAARIQGTKGWIEYRRDFTIRIASCCIAEAGNPRRSAGRRSAPATPTSSSR